jgi:hypothetical protein
MSANNMSARQHEIARRQTQKAVVLWLSQSQWFDIGEHIRPQHVVLNGAQRELFAQARHDLRAALGIYLGSHALSQAEGVIFFPSITGPLRGQEICSPGESLAKKFLAFQPSGVKRRHRCQVVPQRCPIGAHRWSGIPIVFSHCLVMRFTIP